MNFFERAVGERNDGDYKGLKGSYLGCEQVSKG